MTKRKIIKIGISLILLYFLFFTNSIAQIPNYFITGAKKTGYDTLAKKTSQKLALESAGIFEKEIDPSKYVLGPDDQLMISIISANPQEYEVPISPDGRILIPQVGAINLKNKTLAEGEELIKQKVSKIYKTDEVYVVLTKIRKFKVAISGEVFSSTIVPATAVDRVSEIAEKAGGFKHTASLRHIKLIRDNKIINVDLMKYYFLGNKDANPTVLGGDQIVVPVSDELNKIEIQGEVNSPGEFEYCEGDSLSTLIMFGLGFLESSFLDSVELVSFVDLTNITSRVLNLSEWKKYQNLVGQNLPFDCPLKTGDRVYIKKIPDWHYDSKVVIEGQVTYPGIYAIQEGKTRVTDLIAKAGGLTDKAYIEGAVLIRTTFQNIEDRVMERIANTSPKDRTKFEERYFQARINERRGEIAINFKKILENPDSYENIFLKKKDSIYVPAKKEFVNIQGQVMSPGMVFYNPNYTYLDYINLAGGFNYRADINQTIIVKEKGEQLLAKNMDYSIKPGDNILVPPESDVTFFDIFSTGLTIATQLVTIAGVILTVVRLQ